MHPFVEDLQRRVCAYRVENSGIPDMYQLSAKVTAYVIKTCVEKADNGKESAFFQGSIRAQDERMSLTPKVGKALNDEQIFSILQHVVSSLNQYGLSCTIGYEYPYGHNLQVRWTLCS